MHDAATSVRQTKRRLLITAATLTAVALVTFLVAPRAAQFQLLVLAAVPGLALLRTGDFSHALIRAPLLGACVAFGVYITVNASWAVNLAEAYGKVLFYWVLLITTHFAIVGLGHISDEVLDRMQRAAVIATSAGVVFLLLEMLTGQMMHRSVFSLLPFIRPPPKHAMIVDGEVVAFGAYNLNRNMAAICLVLWPIALMLRTLLDTRRALVAAGALMAASLVAVSRSEHETSMLALALSVVAFGSMALAASLTRKAIAVAWLVATLFVAPLVTLAYQQQLHFAEWLPVTARNRVILWAFTAGEVAKAPIFGVGVASTKTLDEAYGTKAQQPPGFTYALRTGPHSHNAFLQTWYELGAIGAVLLLAMGLCAIAVLSRLPHRDQPQAFASFVAAAVIGSFTWGMWQTWFMAAYGIWAVLLALACAGSWRKSQRQASMAAPYSSTLTERRDRAAGADGASAS